MDPLVPIFRTRTGEGFVSLGISSKVKRSAVAVLASGAAVASSLAIATAPAQAATCATHNLSTVSFTICISRASSTSAKASVSVNSGTYISGKLTIAAPNGSSSQCSGKIYPGGSCSWTKSGGSGSYYTAWNTVSGGTYEGPALYVS